MLVRNSISLFEPSMLEIENMPEFNQNEDPPVGWGGGAWASASLLQLP